MDLQQLLPLINTGGVVALLLFQALLFFRGDIISRKVLDDIITATVVRVLREMERLNQLRGTTQLDEQ